MSDAQFVWSTAVVDLSDSRCESNTFSTQCNCTAVQDAVLLPEFLLIPFSVRHRRTSSTRVQAAAWLPTFWASVIAIMTTSCSAPLVTCSTSTLGSSWATPRCLAASRGETQATSIASFQGLWALVWCHLFMWAFSGHVIHAEDLKDLITTWVKSRF